MNAGPKTACGGKRPQAGVFAQPLAGNPRAIFRAAENESFSPEKHVISTRAEYISGGVLNRFQFQAVTKADWQLNRLGEAAQILRARDFAGAKPSGMGSQLLDVEELVAP